MTDTAQYARWFRHASPYINAHRGRTFVLMLGGEALADANFDNIVHDIALLNSLGVRLVLVCGARPQIETQLAARGLAPRLHNGLRITDAPSLNAVIAAVGEVRAHIEALLSMGLANSPMHGAQIRVVSGNFTVARPLGVLDGVDYLHTGEVRRLDVEAIRRQLEDGAITLLTPIGYSPTGEVFNLSYEDVATHAAAELGADKLIAFGPDSGWLDARQQLVRELPLSDAEAQLAQVQEPERLRTLRAAVRACKGGVPRCHLLSYHDDGALLRELFTRDGAGTLITRDSFEQVRQASIDDVGGILELIRPLEEDGTLVRRSRELLENEIEQFTVVERDGSIIACAALYPYPDSAMAEIACVVTHPDYRRGNRGEQLLSAVEARARALGISRAFVLTTRTAHWFIEKGFSEGQVSELPSQKQALYNYQRNSKVFFKHLRPV